jgi:hypothetical protein
MGRKERSLNSGDPFTMGRDAGTSEQLRSERIRTCKRVTGVWWLGVPYTVLDETVMSFHTVRQYFAFRVEDRL